MSLRTRLHSDPQAVLLVLGGTGFIGSRVVEAARQSSMTVRSPRRTIDGGTRMDAGVVDVRDDDALSKAMTGVAAVIHCISYVGNDPLLARQTNLEGTRSVVAAAERSGRPRLIYVSTASVAGSGPHRVTTPHPPQDRRPESVVSRSRAGAEAAVIAYGGTVVRPNLVYGPGDRWFGPALLALLSSHPSERLNWRGLVSTVAVDDLARGLVQLAASPERYWRQRTLYLNSPVPGRMSQIASIFQALIDDTSATLDGDSQREGAPLSPHQRSLLTVDNWFDSGDAWDRLGVVPSAAFNLTRDAASWYSSVLQPQGQQTFGNLPSGGKVG